MKDSADSKDQQLLVALRVRPISASELEEGATLIAHKVDEQMVVLMDPMEDPDDILRANRSREKSYLFDMAFDFTATQEMVYRATTKGLIEGVLCGYNATVFAYGPTGCGKTYTMLGTDQEPGIYVRTLNDLFHAIEETSDHLDYEVSMSYLEIYNEVIQDLLNPSAGYLDLREDAKGGVQVAGITEVSTVNAKETMQLLLKGNKQRTQEPTAANQTSSRSHAVLQVTVKRKSRGQGILHEVRRGRLFMIDLAGSERASQTQNRGQRMKEGAHINRSLLALGNCINALSGQGGNKYVNYRDSKLTRLLKDSLGGNSRTVMIAHISPASGAFEESRHTLTYAGRAKNIKTRVNQNLLSVSYHMAQYTGLVADLRAEIQRLKGKIDSQNGRGRGRPEPGDIRQIQAEVQMHSIPCGQQGQGQMRALLLGALQEQMDLRRRLLDLKNQALDLQVDTSRHLLTIADWEQEKSRRTLKWKEELRKESTSKDDSEKDSDTGDEQPDIPEPPEVAAAREAVAATVGEQEKLHRQKVELEQVTRECRQRARGLEETLARRVGSEEQREALSLLCRLHELEVENIEAQGHSLLRPVTLGPRGADPARLDQHRRLCDRLIRGQRRVIHDHRLKVPGPLEELFGVYLKEQQEDHSLEPIAVPHQGAAKNLQISAPARPGRDTGENPLPIDSNQETVKNLQRPPQRTPPPGWPGKTLPPLCPEAESEGTRVFKASPRAWQTKGSAVMTPPPIRVNGLVVQEGPPHDAPSNQGCSSPDSSETSEIPRPWKEREEVLAGTKNIAVKAARQRSRALGEGRWRPRQQQLLAPPRPPTERSTLSLHSLSEAEDPPGPGAPPAGRRPPSPALQHAASEDNLSSSPGDGPSRAPWLRGQGPGHRREESLEAKRRKRKSWSFEVTGQGVRLSRPKNQPPGSQPVESPSDPMLPGGGQAAPSTRAPGKVALPLTKVRLPQSQATGSGDFPAASVSSTQPVARGTHLAHGAGTSAPSRDGRFRHNR
ncbi:kinesin-like protein KIF19 isoform X2 [Ornithorhynchus anatinus]|uniref:kinesin-like protein KIF19 isoform X2 n=1 Tax=Ornithorhynchus anatinus TaxID=9258 RepID=UPI0010A85FBE|nr:kinesin-like protein KIF19 isoform X2 [Ornithorhynchus anatinus]